MQIHKDLREDSAISKKQNKTKPDTFRQYVPCPFYTSSPPLPQKVLLLLTPNKPY